VEITESGGYRLTAELRVPDENTTAILVSGERVWIDLGGFAIVGVTECTGFPTVCSPVGTGVGIDFGPDSVGSVSDGLVAGMGDTGIRRADGLVENVIAHGNGGVGISTRGTVRNCRAVLNGRTGISCASAQVLDNTTERNGLSGIGCLGASLVRGNRVETNGGAADSPGINASEGMVIGNFVVGNAGAGLLGTSNVSYGHNVFRDNHDAAGGPTPANQGVQGDQLGPNLCQGVPCP
jgi:hypothetical protein